MDVWTGLTEEAKTVGATVRDEENVRTSRTEMHYDEEEEEEGGWREQFESGERAVNSTRVDSTVRSETRVCQAIVVDTVYLVELEYSLWGQLRWGGVGEGELRGEAKKKSRNDWEEPNEA